MEKTLVPVPQSFCQQPGEWPVRSQPVDVLHLAGAEPPDCVVLPVPRHRLTIHERRGRDPEHEPIPDPDLGLQPVGHGNHAAELLGDLTDSGLVRGLAVIDLATGELPPAGRVGGIAAPGSEHTAVVDDGNPDDEGHATQSAWSNSGVRDHRTEAATDAAKCMPPATR